MSDQELVTSLPDSEPAFTEIYNRYWDKLLFVAAVKLQNTAMAEEVVQEIFVNIWNRKNQLTITVSLEAYLSVAVKYRIINAQLKLRREQDFISEQLPPVVNAEHWLDEKELHKHYQQLISELPEKCRITYIRKYRSNPVLNGDNANNIPVIRYADVLLMYAECLNEAAYNGAGDAMRYLNMIRRRARLAEKTAADIPGQAAFRLAIEQERRVEFAFEGHRWFDLVRTNRAIAVINSKATSINIVAPITQNNLVAPIPQSQVEINRDKMKQNPGY